MIPKTDSDNKSHTKTEEDLTDYIPAAILLCSKKKIAFFIVSGDFLCTVYGIHTFHSFPHSLLLLTEKKLSFPIFLPLDIFSDCVW